MRAAGGLAVVHLGRLCLDYLGVFEVIHVQLTWFFQKMDALQTAIEESSDQAAAWFEFVGAMWSAVTSVIDPWNVPMFLFAIFFVIKYGWEISDSTTPLDTPGPSATQSSNQSPLESPRTDALQTLTKSVEAQSKAMESLVSKLQALERIQHQNMQNQEDAQNLNVLSTQARLEAQNESHAKSWAKMQERVDAFEAILKDDRVKGGAAKDAGSTGGLDSSSRGRALGEGEEGQKAGVSTSDAVGGDGEMSILIKKLQKEVKTPQEIFVEALKDYEEVDADVWATNFPVGYRERTAAHTLGEIYSKGDTAKKWGKEWLKEKELGDCQEAREILQVLWALDCIFLVDQVKGAINQVGVEKLVKKVNGIRFAFAEVKCVGDWKKPQNAKNWKSKVDYVVWARTDNAYLDKEHVFINRKAEDEQRTEMERDAALIKAKLKLAAGEK